MSDYAIKTIGEIESAVKNHNISLTQIIEAIIILCGQGSIAPANEENIIKKAKIHTDKLNNHLINHARGSNEISFLASPVTGGGINIDRFRQLFLGAYKKGLKQPEQWAQYTWNILSLQGQSIVKDGKALEKPEDNIKELKSQADIFNESYLPIIKALKII